MNRKEENIEIIKHFHDKAIKKSNGSFEEMVVFNLGVIASMLADASKSLSIIADKEERSGEE